MSHDAIVAAVDARRQDLIGLARHLIGFTALNPPLRMYREICDDLAARLLAQSFDVEMIRGDGAPGDGDGHPRWNLVVRISREPGDCVHFDSHYDGVEVGHGWTRDPFAGKLEGDRLVWQTVAASSSTVGS